MREIRAVVAAGRHVEPPRRDALAPVRKRKRHVVAAVRRHEEFAQALFGTAGRQPVALGQRRVHARDARRIGAALPVGLAAAVAHRDGGVAHRRGIVQLRHPDQRRFAPELEMHAQVRDQRGGAHVEGLRLAEQRRAQFRARELDHVEARVRQRNADHLERLGAERLGHGDPRLRVGAGEDRLRRSRCASLSICRSCRCTRARSCWRAPAAGTTRRSACRRRASPARLVPGSAFPRAAVARTTLTWPGSTGSTLRTVTGSNGFSLSGSTRSRIPKSAANLASGGFSSVRTLSGKERALASARPASSRSPSRDLDPELLALRQSRPERHAYRCRRPRPISKPSPDSFSRRHRPDESSARPPWRSAP